MSLPNRFAPPTQMDALRALLGAYSEADREFETALHRALQPLRELALPELGRRLARSTTPKGLRLLLLEATATFDWPEWDVHLMHLLQPEEDLELFDQGCAALGSLCTPRAFKWLQRLKDLRRDPERQAILERELAHYQSGHDFEAGLAFLSHGAEAPEVARLGARALAAHLALAGGSEAREAGLVAAFHEGDPLVRHLALRLLAYLTDEASDAVLVTLFQEALESPPDSRVREALDDIAGLLATRVEAGKIPLETALPLLGEPFHSGQGGEGLLVAYLRLVDPDDKGRLDRVLADQDIARRIRCIEVLGAREEDRLVPFFLRAMNDIHPEVAHLAIRQFGKLPSGAPAMLKLLRSEHLDQVRLAVRFFGENRVHEATKSLMGLLPQDTTPDDLMVDAVQALGLIGEAAATRALLNLLHDGKPLLLQLALVEALGRLRTPEASLGLLKKAEGLKLPQVLHLALDGVLAAFPDFEHPFPPEQLAALEHLAERCCDPREGEGHWQHVALAFQELFVFDAEAYRRWKDRFTDLGLTARHRTGAERQEAERVQAVLQILLHRAVHLTGIEEREAQLEAALETAATPESRSVALDQLEEALAAADGVLTAPLAARFCAFVTAELAREDLPAREAARLCHLAGASGLRALVEPLREAFAHAPTPEVKTAARQAAKALGLADHELERRAPIRAIHVLEPNAFFRKRLAGSLEQQGRSLGVSGSRAEAEAALAAQTADLLISETHDEAGDLAPWLQQQWEHHRVRYVLLSTANHDVGPLADRPWVIGRLYKPYPLDEVTRVLEG